MIPLRHRTKQLVNRLFALESASPSSKTWAVSGFVARLSGLVHSLGLQRGFSLIESVAAVGLIGIAVVGSVVLLGATVRTSANVQGDLGLIQLARAQVETIQSVPYNDDPSQYPLIKDLPPEVTVAFETTDPDTKYQVGGVVLGQVVQQIEVTAQQDGRMASIVFYKINAVGLPTPTPFPLPTATPVPPPTATPTAQAAKQKSL